MARCGCGSSSCNCIITVADTSTVLLDLDGNGSVSNPYEIEGTLLFSSENDFFAGILGIDDPDLGDIDVNSIASSTKLSGPTGLLQGVEVINLPLVSMDPENDNFAIYFQVFYTVFSAIEYELTVSIWVSGSDCDEKLFATDTYNIVGPLNDSLIFNPIGDWTVLQEGTDLVFVPEDENIISTGGGCYMAQMKLSWIEVP